MQNTLYKLCCQVQKESNVSREIKISKIKTDYLVTKTDLK